MLTHVNISAIQFDSATQVRAEINNDVVNDYAAAMAANVAFPPAELFSDGQKFWIGDGWHRLLAAQRNGDVTFPCNVQPGGRQAAIKHSLGANATHGLKRSNADKRKAVTMALKLYAELSDRALADICAVTNPFVAKIRAEVLTVSTSTPTHRTGSDGKSYPATQPARPVSLANAGRSTPARGNTAPTEEIEPLSEAEAPQEEPAIAFSIIDERDPMNYKAGVIDTYAPQSTFDKDVWKDRWRLATRTFLERCPASFRAQAATWMAQQPADILPTVK